LVEAARVFVLAVLVTACSRTEREDSAGAAALASFKIAGSTAVLPVVTEAANAFMKSHAGVSIHVDSGGSRVGLARVAAGNVAIGTSDVFVNGDLSAKLEDHKIGVVGLAAMANRGPFNESVRSLTREQLRRIFMGQARDWSEVGGGSQVITVINRPDGSGTRAAFRSIVLGGDQFVHGTTEQETSAQLQATLLETRGAISYLAISYRHPDLAVFEFEGQPPSSDAIATGAYPIWSYEHMYTLGPAVDQVRAFIDFVLSPPIQNDALVRAGFIPIGSMKVSRQHD
jgi:phosphate transport system substrate-binding protein